MTTSQKTSFLSEIETGVPIPAGKRAYFGARTRNQLYNLVLRKFQEQEADSGLTRADLARRIGRRPEVITRLLSTPGNWTLDTASDLLLGIAGEELKFSSSPVLGRAPRNYAGPEWLSRKAPKLEAKDAKPELLRGSGPRTESFSVIKILKSEPAGRNSP